MLIIYLIPIISESGSGFFFFFFINSFVYFLTLLSHCNELAHETMEADKSQDPQGEPTSWRP